jgi:hypothetical protein
MSHADVLFDPEMRAAQHALEVHPVFSRITDLPILRAFMRVHVFAVWDFMSLAKRLQRDFTCLDLPWSPPPDIAAARLINEIILGEETDIGPDGRPASHLELYLGAMAEIGADTTQFDDFLAYVKDGVQPMRAMRRVGAPRCAADFVRRTLDVALSGTTSVVLANFFYGRENVIPSMFTGLLQGWGIAREAAPRFVYYLDRHIELDGDSHGPAAASIIQRALERDPEQAHVMRTAALSSLAARQNLWDGTLQVLEHTGEPRRRSVRDGVLV